MLEHASGTWSPQLTVAEKETLLAIAHDTLNWCVQRAADAKSVPAEFSFVKYDLTAALKKPMATFVTLKQNGDLRGCIGSLEPREALYLSVYNNTINAALKDFRFSPVRPRELNGLSLAISVLSPIRAIASANEFECGRMGIILNKSGRRAVFLPEVATEQGWTREETLRHLSMKAGLPADAWQSGASFQVFESWVLEAEK